MNRARREYYTNLISENSHDQWKFFTLCRSLLGFNKSFSLPSYVNNMTLANEMGHFFAKKISNIKLKLANEIGSPQLPFAPSFVDVDY